MDADRFDNLIRSLLLVASRRGVLVGLTNGLLAVLPFALGGQEAEAKRKKKKKKKHKKKKQCTPNCSGKICGDDGCGGSCGACDACQDCQGGTCLSRCAVGQVCLSNGSCATPCADGTCGAHCAGCGVPNAEGERYCLARLPGPPSCPTQPICEGTADCPLGTECLSCGSMVCYPLCPAG